MEYVVLALNLVVAFFLLNSMYNCRLHFGGTIWNITVPMSEKQKKYMTRNRIIMVVSIIAFVVLIIPVFKALLTLVFSGSLMGFFKRLLLAFGYFLLFVGSAFAGGYIAYSKAPTSPLLVKENNAAILGELPFIKCIEEQIDQAQSFYVGFDGIALCNDMYYCYAVVHYEDFQMGPLDDASQVALMGLYFVQKYHHQFTFRIDSVYIPGEPGQSITVVGSSGHHVAYTQGTKGQTIFRGYIFNRFAGK